MNKNYQKNDVSKPLELEVVTTNFVNKLTSIANDIKIEFDDYQKQCVFNALRTIDPMVRGQGLTINSFDQNNVILALQQVAFLRLNPSANPRECYFIVRKNKDKQGNEVPTLEFGIEGAGNDRILMEFGRDVKAVKSYIVYEEDEFTEGYMDGWDVILPKYKRTFKTNRPKMAVYLIRRADGETDVLYATMDDVKKSLLAGAKQNGADDKLLREIEKETVWALLTDEKWLTRVIRKEFKKWNQTTKKYEVTEYTSPLFNPSYTSPNSRDNMVERKLRNHATRKYPKNFDRTELKSLYEETFEEEKLYKKNQIIDAEERLELAQEEFDTETGSKELGSDTIVTPTKKVVKEKEPVGETLEVVEEETTVEEETYVEEPAQEELDEETTNELPADDDLPDFMK